MQIHIIRRPETINAELYLYEISDDKRTVTSFESSENGEVIATTHQRERGVAIASKPFMTLREEDMRAFIKAVIDYAREEGYKTPDDSFTKGKLDATQVHLQDLRKLLKL